MTQEELDAMINGSSDIGRVEEDKTVSKEVKSSDLPLDFSKVNTQEWLLRGTEGNEEKTSKIFDTIEKIFNILEKVNTDLIDQEENIQEFSEMITSNINLFTTLSKKFPEVKVFKTQLEKNQEALTKVNTSIEALQNDSDSIVKIMDLIQYQDTNRQKVKRAVNVIRTLSTYMSDFLESKTTDNKSSSHDIISADNIEALLKQFGK